MQVHRTVTIDKDAATLYQFWRNPDNLPRFMAHVESVQATGEGRARWVVALPLDRRVEWESEISESRDNELLAWQSLPDSAVEAAGKVLFKAAPQGRGTEVHATLDYNPPGGVVGDAIAGFFEEGMAEKLQDELRRFKQLMEAGEIATITGQPTGNQEPTDEPQA